MQKENLSPDEILAFSGKSAEETVKAFEGRLSDDKKNELFKVLSDKKAIEELLKSERAQALMNRLKGGK